MVQIVGKYEFVSNENFEAFVNAMGEKEMATPFLQGKPIIEISQNGDEWSVVINSEGRTSSTTFKLNETYEEKLPSFNRTFPSVATKEGDKLKVVTTVNDNITLTRLYEFTDTGMKVHLSESKTNVMATRTYKRL
ncbi:fatty acid-binding protein homolog 9-like [Hylaeus volcanicus]|uniref:fatty acid-binding protein homolog 9-like n=1 Tax=Hylaeus volcanicus TaxID=313075 RepID=UPI0023B7781E|nr:fatty acid-binding protein homolog 9-like [Hylaeus volcanicus]